MDLTEHWVPADQVARLQRLLSDAVAALDQADRAERLAYCRRTGRVGIRMTLDDDGSPIFWWADRLLVRVDRADPALWPGATPGESS